MTTNTNPMPPVPAGLGRIDTTPAARKMCERMAAQVEASEFAAAADAPELDIDAVLKDVGSQVDTDEQWIDIGLACLDQGGLSLRDQDRILAIIQGRA